MILISIIFITTTVFSCIFMQEFVYYTFLAIFLIIIPLPLFIFGIIGIVSATKRVEVYKGKVIYHIGFKNKEYRMSDIKTSKTKSETYRTGLDCRSWHRILGLARTSPLRVLCDYLHLLEGWKQNYAPSHPDETGVPNGTQQSGSVGERTSSGMSELSPQGGSEGYAACEDEDDRFVEACQMLDYVEYLADLLIAAELEQRVKIVEMLNKDA